MRGLLALALVASLAGCASSAPASESLPDEVEPADGGAEPEDPPTGADADATAPPPTSPGPIVHYVNASVTSVGTSMIACITSECQIGYVFGFERPEGATSIVAELRWDAVADLDLSLGASGSGFPQSLFEERPSVRDDDGLPAAPDTIARVEMSDATALAEYVAWNVAISGKVAVDVAFELRISIFATAPPADYSAFTEERPGPRAP